MTGRGAQSGGDRPRASRPAENPTASAVGPSTVLSTGLGVLLGRCHAPKSGKAAVDVRFAPTEHQAAASYIEAVDDLFLEVHRSYIDPRITMLLGGSRMRRWLTAPVRHVIESGRHMKFFGVGAMASVSDGALTTRDIAAWSTITRGVGLALDDLVDGSEERMGRPSANAHYGKIRCWTAILTTTAMFIYAMVLMGPSGTRLRRTRLTVEMIAGARTQAPHCEGTLAGQVRKSRYYFETVWWALLSAHKPSGRTAERTLKDLVRHYSLGEKILNDLRDYYGRGSKTQYGDFNARKATFPTLALLECAISDEERHALNGHFSSDHTTLCPAEVVAMMERYGVRESLVSMAVQEMQSAQPSTLRSLGFPSTICDYLEVLIAYSWCQAVVDADLARPVYSSGNLS